MEDDIDSSSSELDLMDLIMVSSADDDLSESNNSDSLDDFVDNEKHPPRPPPPPPTIPIVLDLVPPTEPGLVSELNHDVLQLLVFYMGQCYIRMPHAMACNKLPLRGLNRTLRCENNHANRARAYLRAVCRNVLRFRATCRYLQSDQLTWLPKYNDMLASFMALCPFLLDRDSTAQTRRQWFQSKGLTDEMDWACDVTFEKDEQDAKAALIQMLAMDPNEVLPVMRMPVDGNTSLIVWSEATHRKVEETAPMPSRDRVIRVIERGKHKDARKGTKRIGHPFGFMYENKKGESVITLASEIETLPEKALKLLPRKSPFRHSYVLDGQTRDIEWLAKHLVRVGPRNKQNLKKWKRKQIQPMLLKKKAHANLLMQSAGRIRRSLIDWRYHQRLREREEKKKAAEKEKTGEGFALNSLFH